MPKENISKRNATAKVSQNINKYLEKVKPKYSTKFTVAVWKRVRNILFGLICGQSCYLNTIAEHTPHYLEKKRKERFLKKEGQIEKISGHLLLPVFGRVIFSYFKYLRKKYFKKAFYQQSEKRKIKKMNIKDRIYNKPLALHDGSDIQKKYAKKMEDLCRCRDGSESSSQKTVTGKGYLLEGCVAFWQGRLFPLLLSLYSYTDKKYLNDKEETKKNLKILEKNTLSEGFLHVFDRGYDAISFMNWCFQNGVNFLIRATTERSVILPDEFERRIDKCTTQKKRNEIFYPLKNLIKRLSFQKSTDPKYSWFSVAFTKVLVKGEHFPKDSQDTHTVTLISVRIDGKDSEGNRIEGIEEDLQDKKKGQKKGEREIHFYTSEEVETIEDAIVLFLCYLTRWKIEVFFRFLKQVFDLEKICLQSFQKSKNLISILVIAAYYLYGKFHNFQNINEQKETLTLEKIFNTSASKRDDQTIVSEILFFHYHTFCKEKNLTHNQDSFAKSIKELMKYSIEYQYIKCDVDFFDSG